MSSIERLFAIDWSGAQKGSRGKIWLCEIERGRVRRLECGRSRGEIADELIAEARRDPRFAVGFDFAFSFPAAFLEKRAHHRVETVWRETAALGEQWLVHCPNPPFWGKPGKKKPPLGNSLHRATELEIRKKTGALPLSVFQIGGVGAVGVGSIRGMPVLSCLRDAGFSIWPFHETALPLAIEIWPRVFIGNLNKSSREHRCSFLDEHHPELRGTVRADALDSDDAFDALVSALAMDRHRAALERLRPASDPARRLEGEIWLPDPRGDPDA